MKNYLLFFISVFLVSCSVQKEVKAAKNKSGDLVGVATKASFSQSPYNAWFQQKYLNYKPDVATISTLKENLKGVTIKGFMGTWCGDSKRETPQFYKLLDAVNFDEKKLELVTVDRSKKTPDNLQEGYDVIRVPTFIFYKKGKEIGRYVERPRESLQKDIIKIVSGQPYKHSYDTSK